MPPTLTKTQQLPKYITHANYRPIWHRINAEAREYQRPMGDAIRLVVMEVPLGELADGNLVKLLMLTQLGAPITAALTGNEGFAAQGLEGKARCRMYLGGALLLLDNGMIKPFRGRIVTTED